MVAVVSIGYRLVPQQDVVVQPLTSKVVKQLLVEAVGDSAVRGLLMKRSRLRRAPEKPIKLGVLRDQGGRYLWGDGSRPITLRAGAEYFFDVVFIDSPANAARLGIEVDPYKVVNELMSVEGVYTLYGVSRAYVEPTGPAKVVTGEELGKGLDGAARVGIVFKTPTLLQYPKTAPVVRRSVHVLWPDPVLLMLSLVRKWNTYEPANPVSSCLPCFAPYELEVVDHRVRPATVQIGKTRERGFIGWAVVRVATRSRRRMLAYLRLLDFARYVGVGRSTTLGLGSVKLSMAREGEPLKDLQ